MDQTCIVVIIYTLFMNCVATEPLHTGAVWMMPCQVGSWPDKDGLQPQATEI